MSKTLDQMTQNNWSWGGTDGYARYIFSDNFVDEDGRQFEGPNSYIEVPTTISGNIVTIPAYPNFPTTEAAILNNGVTVSCYLYDINRARRSTLFEDCRIYNSLPSVISLTELELANGSGLSHIPRDTETATQEWVIDYVESRPPAAKMTALAYGIARLSVAAADPADPIVIGANDPRFGAYSEDYASLAAAVTAIGATPTDLNITNAFASGASTTVPATLRLVFKSGGSIVLGAGHTVIVRSSTKEWPLSQIFSGTGVVSFNGNGALGDIYPQWWGGNPGDTSDDTAAIQAALTAAKTLGHTDATVYLETKGARVFLTAGVWRVTGLNIEGSNISLEGVGPATRLAMTAGAGDTLTIWPTLANVTFNAAVRNMRIEPLVVRDSGTSEIRIPQFSTFFLEDLVIWGCYRCISLGNASGSSSWGYIRGIRTQNHYQAIKLIRAVDVNISDMKSDSNYTNALAWLIEGGVEGMQVNNVSVVNGLHPSTHGATSTAMRVQAVEYTSPARYNTISNSFFDSHAQGLNIESGGNFKFSNTWFAGADSDSVVLQGDASNIGFDNCQFVSGIIGIEDYGFNTTVANCDFFNAGELVGSGGIGIYAQNSSRGLTVTGSRFFNYTNRGTPQAWGIQIHAAADRFTIKDNTFLFGFSYGGVGNTMSQLVTGAITNAAGIAAGRRIISGNNGYQTENGGTATVANGTTSIVVNHGLAATPSVVDITARPSNSMGNATKWWIDTVTTTQFTINVNADPGATTATFTWSAALRH